MKKFRHLPLEIKMDSLAEDGSFRGYGSVFGVKDSYGDVVMKGAFNNSLSKRGMPKLLWQHRSDAPIGVFTNVFEDQHGLIVEGKLATDSTMGKDAYALLKMGAIDGLSIGYYLKQADFNKEEKTLYVKEVDLLEVSLVTFPANEESQVESVKSEFLNDDINKTVTDLLKRVRELEFMLEAKNTDESVAVVEEIQEKAEAETHENGEDDGAKEAVDALDKLLATLRGE